MHVQLNAQWAPKMIRAKVTGGMHIGFKNKNNTEKDNNKEVLFSVARLTLQV